MDNEQDQNLVGDIPMGQPPAKYFTFSMALSLLKLKTTVSRKAFGDNIQVKLQTPTDLSKMTEPYIYMEKIVKTPDTSELKLFPLDLSCESIMAEDWYIVE